MGETLFNHNWIGWSNCSPFVFIFLCLSLFLPHSLFFVPLFLYLHLFPFHWLSLCLSLPLLIFFFFSYLFIFLSVSFFSFFYFSHSHLLTRFFCTNLEVKMGPKIYSRFCWKFLFRKRLKRITSKGWSSIEGVFHSVKSFHR